MTVRIYLHPTMAYLGFPRARQTVRQLERRTGMIWVVRGHRVVLEAPSEGQPPPEDLPPPTTPSGGEAA